MKRQVVAAALALCLVDTYPAVTLADSRCLEAYENAQLHRRAGELLAARESLRICAQNACQPAIRAECVEWLSEVEKAIPSFVIHPHDGGQDVVDVTVTIDDKQIATALTGKPLEVDPGSHVVQVSRGQNPPIVRRILITEGQKGYAVEAEWNPPKPVTTVQPAIATERPIPLACYILAGVGVASFGAATIFWQSALSKRTSLQNSCAPFCSSDDTSSFHTRLHVADAFIGIGAAALGASVVVFLVRPERPIHQEAGIPALSLSPTPSGLVAHWQGTF